MSKHAVKKLPFVIRYVPDQYKTQQMCDKAILENGGTLESVPECYKNQRIHDKAVDNYPHALKFVPDSYITQKMCDKGISTHPSTIKFVPECHKTQEMCAKAVNRCFFFFFFILFLIGIKLNKCVTVASEDPFWIVYCPDKYIKLKECWMKLLIIV